MFRVCALTFILGRLVIAVWLLLFLSGSGSSYLAMPTFVSRSFYTAVNDRRAYARMRALWVPVLCGSLSRFACHCRGVHSALRLSGPVSDRQHLEARGLG